jgi:hypothetical protein
MGNNASGMGLNSQLSCDVRLPIKVEGKVFSIIGHEGSGGD